MDDKMCCVCLKLFETLHDVNHHLGEAHKTLKPWQIQDYYKYHKELLEWDDLGAYARRVLKTTKSGNGNNASQ